MASISHTSEPVIWELPGEKKKKIIFVLIIPRISSFIIFWNVHAGMDSFT